MSNINIDAIIALVMQGFVLGAMIGVIVGSLTWSMVNPGLPPIFPMIIMGVIGLAGGAFVEGSAFLGMMSVSTLLGSSSGSSFGSFVAVLGWVVGGLAIGAAIGNLSRAVVGALLGAVMGTAAGMIMLSFQDRISFPAEHPLGTVLIGVMVLLFVFLSSLGQGSGLRR